MPRANALPKQRVAALLLIVVSAVAAGQRVPEVDSSLLPPQRHSIKVIVLDSATGAPIRGFAVLVKAERTSKAGLPDESMPPQPWKTVFTNSKGEAIITNPPRGLLHILAQCPPVRGIDGGLVATAGLLPGAGIDTVIEFRFKRTACAELAPVMLAEAERHRRDVEQAKVDAAARAVAGNWWGVLRDGKTGRPIPRAWIRVDNHGPGLSDSTGHFWLWDFAPGTHTISVYCPVRRQFLPRIGTKFTFVARPAMKDTADISVQLDGCEDVPIDTVRIHTKGVWSIGFEDGFFKPCKPFDQIPMGGYKNFGYAYVGFASEGVGPEGGWPKVAEENGTTRFFLEVEADLIGPGSYGHMGVGTFLLRITRVLRATAATSVSCGK
jgi:hypothetical protein